MKKVNPTNRTKSTKRVTKDDLELELSTTKQEVERLRGKLTAAADDNRLLHSRLTAKSIALTTALKRIDTLHGELGEANDDASEALDHERAVRTVAGNIIRKLQEERATLVQKLTYANTLSSMQTAAHDATRAALHVMVHGDPHVQAEPEAEGALNGYRTVKMTQDIDLADIKAAAIADQSTYDFDQQVQEELDKADDGCTFPDCDCFDK